MPAPLDDLSRLQAMMTHVDASPEMFRPSQFWRMFQEKNIQQLSSKGITNFKRTINQNYFNWIIRSVEDNQFRSVLRLCAQFPSLDAFKVKLEGDLTLEGFFEQNPLLDPDGHEIYRLFLGMLWTSTALSNPNGLTDVLEEPELGNPIRSTLRGHRISQDVATSIRERNTILAPLEADLASGKPVSIVEIGAGYGRLMDVMLRSAPCKITIVDIAPALYVSQWYLGTLFGQHKRVFEFRPWTNFSEVESELRAAELSFLTPDQFSCLPDKYFDIGVAISNLAEMTPRQCAMYVDRMARKISRYIYIKQWLEIPNGPDNCSFTRSDFDMPGPWTKTIDRVDAVQDLFFETLWRHK